MWTLYAHSPQSLGWRSLWSLAFLRAVVDRS